MNKIPITTVSVKVMRSFDYCHFEVVLGSEQQMLPFAVEEIDALRKEAARLADKAVAQYKTAKTAAESATRDERTLRYEKSNIERIRALSEQDRSETDKADLKAYEDAQFRASRVYNYEDDWRDDEGDDT